MQKRKVNQHARLQNNWLLAGDERGFAIDGSDGGMDRWMQSVDLTAFRYGIFELTFVKSVVSTELISTISFARHSGCLPSLLSPVARDTKSLVCWDNVGGLSFTTDC
jgi:hypothetical protein